jgi:hypothetical protein
MPDLLEVGVWGAVRFQSLQGEPEYLHLYEIPGLDLFNTRGYRLICRCDPPCPTLACGNKSDPSNPSGPQMLRHVKNSGRALYEQLFAMNTAEPRLQSPGRHGNPICSVVSKCILTTRLDLDPASEEEFLHWQEHRHFPEMMATLPGFVSARLARRMDAFSTSEPKYLILWELKGPEAMHASPSLTRILHQSETRHMWSLAQNRMDNLMVRIFPQ